MLGELGEIPLAVRDQPHAQPVTAHFLERRERVLVEVEVFVALPFAHHLDGALAAASGVTAHADA